MNARHTITTGLGFLLALLSFPWALRVAHADEPAPPSGIADSPRAGQQSVERLLEDLAPPWQVIWNYRALRDLRIEVLATRDARAGGKRTAPPQPAYVSYGIIPELAYGIEDNGNEIERLERLAKRVDLGDANRYDFEKLGLLYYETGRFDKALAAFRMASFLSDGHESDRCMLALVNMARGDYDAAKEDIFRAAFDFPSARNLNNRGVYLCAQGNFNRVPEDFLKAEFSLSIPPKDSRPIDKQARPFPKGLIMINQSLAESGSGNPAKALRELQKLLGSSETDRNVILPGLLAAGHVARKAGEFRQSVGYYNLILSENEIAERDRDAYSVPSEVAKRAFLGWGVGEQSQADAWIGRGLALHDLNQFPAAIDSYSQAIRLNPRKAIGYVDRAIASIDSGDLAAADRDLEAALKLDAAEPYAMANRGLLRLCGGEAAAAQADLDASLKLRPDFKPILERLSKNLPSKTNHLRPSPWIDLPSGREKKAP